MKLVLSKVKNSVRKALEEDGCFSDLSIHTKKNKKIQRIKANVVSRQDGFLSGGPWFEEAFKIVDKKAKVTWKVNEGEYFKRNSVIVEVNASLQAVLSAERTSLNFLQMMSGISTKAKKYTNFLKSTDIELLDTRKTLPNLRYEQKYSTSLGGVKNHRFGLFDAIMLKDNHLKAYGGIHKVKKIKFPNKGNFLEIEIEKLSQIKPALKCNPDILLLDNFSLQDIKRAIKLIDNKCLIEVSGLKKPEDIKKYLNLPIHYISLGDLTKNIESIDFSLNIS